MSDQLTPEQIAEAEAKAEAEAAAKAESDAIAAKEFAAAKEMINIITTDRGTFGVEGIAPVGTKRAIHYTAFSDKWMKCADLMSQQRLKKLRKQDEAETGA
jgi:hypothetical protein